MGEVDCDVAVHVQLPRHYPWPLINIRAPLTGSIQSLRGEADPLYFPTIEFKRASFLTSMRSVNLQLLNGNASEPDDSPVAVGGRWLEDWMLVSTGGSRRACNAFDSVGVHSSLPPSLPLPLVCQRRSLSQSMSAARRRRSWQSWSPPSSSRALTNKSGGTDISPILSNLSSFSRIIQNLKREPKVVMGCFTASHILTI